MINRAKKRGKKSVVHVSSNIFLNKAFLVNIYFLRQQEVDEIKCCVLYIFYLVYKASMKLRNNYFIRAVVEDSSLIVDTFLTKIRLECQEFSKDE